MSSRRLLLTITSLATLAGCGEHGSPTYVVGGTVQALSGSGLVLQSGSETLAIAHNGSFSFTQLLPHGAAYAVTIKAQPAAGLHGHEWDARRR